MSGCPGTPATVVTRPARNGPTSRHRSAWYILGLISCALAKTASRASAARQPPKLLFIATSGTGLRTGRRWRIRLQLRQFGIAQLRIDGRDVLLLDRLPMFQ